MKITNLPIRYWPPHNNNTPTSSSSLEWWHVALIAFVVVAVISFVIFYFVSRKQTKKIENDKDVTNSLEENIPSENEENKENWES